MALSCRIAIRVSRSGGWTSTTRPERNRLRSRSSIPPSSWGGRSLAMTIWRSCWCRWLNVWKNSVCVSSARARNCTSSSEQDVDVAVLALEEVRRGARGRRG